MGGGRAAGRAGVLVAGGKASACFCSGEAGFLLTAQTMPPITQIIPIAIRKVAGDCLPGAFWPDWVLGDALFAAEVRLGREFFRRCLRFMVRLALYRRQRRLQPGGRVRQANAASCRLNPGCISPRPGPARRAPWEAGEAATGTFHRKDAPALTRSAGCACQRKSSLASTESAQT